MKALRAMRVVLCLALVASSCTHEKALILSGEGLDAVGVQFQSTVKVMNADLDRQGLNAETCKAEPTPAPCLRYRKWAAFARKFKPAYASAVAVWKAAEETQDDQLLKQAGAIAATLGAELATFAGDAP